MTIKLSTNDAHTLYNAALTALTRHDEQAAQSGNAEVVAEIERQRDKILEAAKVLREQLEKA